MKPPKIIEYPISYTLKSSWATTITVAIVYIAAGNLSHLIKIQPGDISPIFLPAGIALAVALKFGRSALFGVFIGSFFNSL